MRYPKLCYFMFLLIFTTNVFSDYKVIRINSLQLGIDKESNKIILTSVENEPEILVTDPAGENEPELLVTDPAGENEPELLVTDPAGETLLDPAGETLLDPAGETLLSKYKTLSDFIKKYDGLTIEQAEIVDYDANVMLNFCHNGKVIFIINTGEKVTVGEVITTRLFNFLSGEDPSITIENLRSNEGILTILSPQYISNWVGLLNVLLGQPDNVDTRVFSNIQLDRPEGLRDDRFAPAVTNFSLTEAAESTSLTEDNNGSSCLSRLCALPCFQAQSDSSGILTLAFSETDDGDNKEEEESGNNPKACTTIPLASM